MKNLAYYLSLPYDREVIPRDDSSGRYFVVRLRDIPEIYGFGSTRRNALRMMREAMPDHIAYCLEAGIPIPEPDRKAGAPAQTRNLTLYAHPVRRRTPSVRPETPETETGPAPDLEQFETEHGSIDLDALAQVA